MYILNIASAIKKMSVNEPRDFIFENYYKRTGFIKEGSYYSVKRLAKSIYCCLQEKYLILVKLKNTINHL